MKVDYNEGDLVRIWNAEGSTEDPYVGTVVTIQGAHRCSAMGSHHHDDDPCFNTSDKAYWYASEIELVEAYVHPEDRDVKRNKNF